MIKAFLCALVCFVMATPALASHHHYRHYASHWHHYRSAHGHRHQYAHRYKAIQIHREARTRAYSVQVTQDTKTDYGHSGSLVAVARAHMGDSGSIVGMWHNWCGAAMSLFSKLSGHGDPVHGDRRAIAWAHAGSPTNARPGAIAVMHHHVGVVEKVDGNRVLIVSGNHSHHRVGEGWYAMSRILAFRWIG